MSPAAETKLPRKTDYPTLCWGCFIPIPEPPTPICIAADYLCSCCRAMSASCSSKYWRELRRAETRKYFTQVHRKQVLMGQIDE
jgi:hypothetical protein